MHLPHFRSCAYPDPSLRDVDPQLWNEYFVALTSQTADLENDIERYLLREQSSPKRKVTVKVAPPIARGGVFPAAMNEILRLALASGVVESVTSKPAEHSITFTSSESAAIFATLWRAHSGVPSSVLVTDVGKGSSGEGKVLVLGYGINIPSMFISALFCDLYGAQSSIYSPAERKFVITFSDAFEARYALHTLQVPMARNLKLSLTYEDCPLPLHTIW
jgi:hypothetical protein